MKKKEGMDLSLKKWLTGESQLTDKEFVDAVNETAKAWMEAVREQKKGKMG